MRSAIELVEVPDRMSLLPRDGRGYPVPFGVYWDKAGNPQFTINDEGKRQLIIREDLCPLCGFKLLRGRWFVGGPQSAFDPRGAYIDPPMHLECARYALQVCPYLAAPRYSKRIDDRKVAGGNDGMIFNDPTMIPDRPTLFVSLMCVDQVATMDRLVGIELVKYLAPKRPYRVVEFWQHGRQLSEMEALPLLPGELVEEVRKCRRKSRA